jgi:excisionase family DNA binding protein
MTVHIEAKERGSPRKLLKVHEVAQRLSMSTSYIYKAARRGELPVVYIGSSLRFDTDAVERWLSERAQPLLPGPAALPPGERKGEQA